jgi:RNA polymerase sigma factor (sigma-70 family)
MTTSRREATLRALFEEHSTPVLAYALRHIGSSDAQDIVSEVFMVAWRRIDDIPAAAPLPWLLVVARNTIRNKLRGTARQLRVADGLANLQRSSTATAGADETAVERRAMLTALADLSPAEREAVLLTGWDGLSVSHAAQVAGCSRRAFELRLHRARNRLRRHLTSTDDNPGHRYPAARSGQTQEAST